MFPAMLAFGLVVAGAVPASAEEAPAASATKAAAGKKVCKVTDPLLDELSGIVATDDGFIVINDGSLTDEKKKVFFLDDKCAIKNSVAYSGGPLDTEDMIVSPDGKKLWIADTGDNAVRDKSATPRPTVALWTMPTDGSEKPKIHRLSYPDGDKHDAEALLLDGKGNPIIVTKEVTGAAQIYTPTTALKTNNKEGVPLKKVGTLELPRTDTSGTTFARLAQGVVTGGAVSPDGKKVVIRTYLDAFEWDVTNGDVVAALKATPRATGLPNEPFGEAISYSADGKTFVTVSDFGDIDDGSVNYILRYTPATKVVEAKSDSASDSKSAGSSFFSDLSLDDITYLVAGVGVIGLLLVGAGVIGIVKARKKRALEPAPADDDEDDLLGAPAPGDAKTELLTVGGPPRGNAAYAAGAGPSGPIYGAKAAAAQSAGVYGGAAAGAAAAGRPGPGGPGGPQGRPAGGPPGAGQPARGAQPARPGGPGGPGGPQGRPTGGAQAARPAGAAQPGRPTGAAQPPRPGGAAQPARAGGAPVAQPPRTGGSAQPSRPTGAAQPPRPGGAAQPPRPGGAAQPPRPGGVAQPARPAGGAQQGRPTGGAQQGRPSGGAQQGRPAGGGAQGRPAGGAQQGRPAGGAQQGRPADGAQSGRPAGGQGRPTGGAPRPPQGGQPAARPASAPQPGRAPQPPARGGQPPRGGAAQPGRATPPPTRGGGPQQGGGDNGRPGRGGGGVYGGGPQQGGGGGR
ncbi:hypothetical protein Ahu01nite_047490 [Winogradskya humida]|uniref:Uncharacterized protein n=1 Tax=Winogradskya humida TaxID=113566 RepID=A0ABQ3ZST4_9ACTN|nr:hypothetical protein Ahu01nite_047490 [Actinoplanes humidus]